MLWVRRGAVWQDAGAGGKEKSAQAVASWCLRGGVSSIYRCVLVSMPRYEADRRVRGTREA